MSLSQSSDVPSDCDPPNVPPRHRGFTLQHGGRNPIADTAASIGTAVGTVERQMRQALELVRPTPQQPETAFPPQPEPAELAAERLLQFRSRLRDVLSRSRLRASLLVAENPGSTIGALAGFSVAFGLVLLLRGSHRR